MKAEAKNQSDKNKIVFAIVGKKFRKAKTFPGSMGEHILESITTENETPMVTNYDRPETFGTSIVYPRLVFQIFFIKLRIVLKLTQCPMKIDKFSGR